MTPKSIHPQRDHQICICGHRGKSHHFGYAECGLCRQSTDGLFHCEPGTCDRFTWDPDTNRAPKESDR